MSWPRRYCGWQISRFGGIFRSRKLVVLLLVDLLLLAGLTPLTDGFIGSVILIGGLLLALPWMAWERAGKSWAVIYGLVILLGLAAAWRIDLNRDVFETIPWLSRASGMLAFLFILIEVLVVFKLLEWALLPEASPGWPRYALAGLLAVLLLGLAGWQIATAAAWDVATDGLGGIATLQLAGLAGIAAAILVAWRQPASRRTPAAKPAAKPAFLLALALPLYLLAWMNFGTFGFDGPWGRVPIARTERRAGSIDQAIQRFHDQNHHYPSSLEELTPRYLLILPAPFIIPGQDWCYQGGADFYRLGYVYREYFSAPAEVRIIASQGQPPDPAWPCEEEAARYPGPPGFYGEQ